MLAGGFRRRILNRRETTAVASANAAMAMKEPGSCQTTATNSTAIQIVADAANQAVTGWPTTTLAPHPIMMTATTNVTRLSQGDAAVFMEVHAVGPGKPVKFGDCRAMTGVSAR